MKHPYMPRVASLAEGCIQQRNLKLVTVDDVLSVVTLETHGQEWFNPNCNCDALYKANMQALRNGTGITEQQWLEAIRVKSGPNKGLVPKFRWEAGYMEWARQAAPRAKLYGASAAILACSFGLGQKMARWLLSNHPPEKWAQIISEFNADPRLQVDTCAKDLEYLLHLSEGYRPIAYTRYNAGPTAKTVSQYGKLAYDNFTKFQNLRRALS
jgi:hypothetical protein